jgi:hypothetical protein
MPQTLREPEEVRLKEFDPEIGNKERIALEFAKKEGLPVKD